MLMAGGCMYKLPLPKFLSALMTHRQHSAVGLGQIGQAFVDRRAETVKHVLT